ncbi:hypothetical protein [uncultured Winogradskyella sp.]|uniref:hypothetical protein n=1 Tax=uncultured Winogradskyella sp. TaxID=395353 RepID=UPI0026096A87|nr:hypothetical protein [uncultured Winogradskyella sp.]
MRNFILFTAIILLFSCQKGKDSKATTNASESKELIIKIFFKTDVEDVFKIMTNNIEVDEFQKKNIVVRETIPITSNFESMTANFGPNNFSNNIIINLGKKLKEVTFNSIEINYGKNKLIIDNENFNKYLRLNKFAEFVNTDFIIVVKTKGEISNPQIALKPSAIKFLKQ